MAALTGLLIAGIIGAVVSAAGGVVSSAINAGSQDWANKMNAENISKTNAANLQIARENNAQQMDLAKHGIQYRMEDMQAAGLNPVLAAQGAFGSAPTATLSTPNQQAARNIAPQIDLSGLGNAITALNNTMLTQHLIESRENIAANHDATSTANAESRNSVLKDLYKRKGVIANDQRGVLAVNSARKGKINDYVSDKEWKAMLKELASIK